MSWPVAFASERMCLETPGRIDRTSAERQTETARAILKRLEGQPGLVLADEVGMGKTFVALAVAVSAFWADKGRRPVVVMVPPSVRDKWVREFDVFKDMCVQRPEDRETLRAKSAQTALDFFKLLDDPKPRRVSLIFLNHGAFNSSLQDPWVKLAIIRHAIHGLHLGARRTVLPRWVAQLLRTSSKRIDEALYERLLRCDEAQWRETIEAYGVPLDDDPVPEALVKELQRGEIDLSALAVELRDLPLRESPNIDARLTRLRNALNAALRDIWPQALAGARFRSPLLILDEAHHLKNPATRLASLFAHADDEVETRHLLQGALANGFERMLFLTATPFQLGHQELLNVLRRFRAIDWKSLPGPLAKEACDAQLETLEGRLDEARHAAANLDFHWQKLRGDQIVDEQGRQTSVERWWQMLMAAGVDVPPGAQGVVAAFERAHKAMKSAQEALGPWVIRHMRPRCFEGSDLQRRTRLIGAGIRDEQNQSGLPVSDSAVLPFLLAARSQSLLTRALGGQGANRSRATFAEGLASSYEAFLRTRSEGAADVDEEVAQEEAGVHDHRLKRYLSRLTVALPDELSFGQHPKIAALTERVVHLWSAGEKVVVFCHFRETGKALVRHLSAALDVQLKQIAEERTGKHGDAAMDLVRLAGEAFDEDRPMQRALATFVDGLTRARGLPQAEQERMEKIVRRFVRTPVFLARYLDLANHAREEALLQALATTDASGASLRQKIEGFVSFIALRSPAEREDYLEALEAIQPGTRGERPKDDESVGGANLLPNVRLASGVVKAETRKRLLLGFNTPFFPEILVASSVLAEGVDLHLNCRHIIHHDLSWNPSTIEQRTGRVDRIGAKADQVGKAIRVYMPFVAGTQDEKMYRVVTDRERWFQVLMGEEYRTDEVSTEKLAERVMFPEAAAGALAMDLRVWKG